MPSFQSVPCCAALALAVLLFSGSARASLGADESSVVDDARAFRAMPLNESPGGIRRQTIRSGQTHIHEYVGSAGQVYAITFSGGRTPDLKVLLGSHYDDFQANARHDHRSAQVETAGLKASLHGRPGAVSGVIWLPALMPAGVTPESLK